MVGLILFLILVSGVESATEDLGSVTIDVECSDSSMTTYFGPASEIDTVHFPPHWSDASCADYQPFLKNGVSWIVFNTRYDRCGTRVSFTSDVVEYSNAVYYKRVGNSNVISREFQQIVPVKCSLKNSGKSSIIYDPKEVQMSNKAIEQFANFSFGLDMFTDETFSTPYKDEDYPVVVDLSETIYLGATIKSITADIKLFIDECIAKPSSDQNVSPSYEIIQDSCPSDDTTLFLTSINSAVHFSMDAFRFIAAEGPVYVQCDMSVCNATDSTCSRTCNQRNKREVSNSFMKTRVTRGPFIIRGQESSRQQALAVNKPGYWSNQSKLPTHGVLLAMNATFLIAVCLALYMKKRRMEKKSSDHQTLMENLEF